MNVVFIGAQFSSKLLLLICPVCYELFLGSMFQITEFKTDGLTCRDYHLKLKSCQTLCCFETLISHLLHLIAILAGQRERKWRFLTISYQHEPKGFDETKKRSFSNSKMLCLPSVRSFLQTSEVGEAF